MILTLVLAVACGAVTPTPEPVSPAADCALACENLVDMGCPGSEGSPGFDEKYGTDDDVPCADACVELSIESPFFPLECIILAVSCDGVSACFK